jgi:predicted GH43/DUF377 family glycosyl hydrolase
MTRRQVTLGRSQTRVAVHRGITIRHLPVRLVGDARRSIMLPFNMGGHHDLQSVFTYVESLTDQEVVVALVSLVAEFRNRHSRFEDHLEERYESAARINGSHNALSRERRLLIGAYFTMEYSIEAAALFNPSIVEHPDQAGAPRGGLRFIMSLRAVGEGHISTTVFQTGTISAAGIFRLDPPTGRSASPRVVPDARYRKDLLRRKLCEMGISCEMADLVFAPLPELFTHAELDAATTAVRGKVGEDPRLSNFISMLEWLVRANYRLVLPGEDEVRDLVLFPRSDSESKGIEDMRLVRFVDDSDAVTWFGTYTAFNGQSILPMLMETPDFRSFYIHTLNGACVQNKGMALFPRRIGGHYAMCSRIDGRNLYLMFSDLVHFWETATVLARPKYPWEWRLIGNCGSPLQTPEGWLLITHGVGPMRRYSIGAMLLDGTDPQRIRGRLKEPLIAAAEQGSRGYVPNVVYSCGSLIHRERLYLPYAVSDSSTRIAIVHLPQLIDRLLRDGP